MNYKFLFLSLCITAKISCADLNRYRIYLDKAAYAVQSPKFKTTSPESQEPQAPLISPSVENYIQFTFDKDIKKASQAACRKK